MTHECTGPDCFTCKVKTLQFVGVPSGRSCSAAPPEPKNSWEKGVATDHRGLPYLGKDLQPIPIKEFSEHRHTYEEAIRRNKAATAVNQET